jgi:chemotaxis signal transduction protein
MSGQRTDFRVTLRFVGGDYALVLPGGVLGEVLLDTPVVRLPRAPDWVRGLAQLRGDIVPVLWLPHPWVPSAGLQDPKLIMFRDGKQGFAVEGDVVIGFDQVRAAPGAPSRTGQLADYFTESWLVGEDDHRGIGFDVMRWGRERRSLGVFGA